MLKLYILLLFASFRYYSQLIRPLSILRIIRQEHKNFKANRYCLRFFFKQYAKGANEGVSLLPLDLRSITLSFLTAHLQNKAK